MIAFVVWLLLAFAASGIVCAFVLWRSGKLDRTRALALAGCSALGAVALIFLASRGATRLFSQPLLPIDLPILAQQTLLPVAGVVLGGALALGLAYAATRVPARETFLALLALVLVIGIGGLLYLRVAAAPTPEVALAPPPPKDPQVIEGFRVTRFA